MHVDTGHEHHHLGSVWAQRLSADDGADGAPRRDHLRRHDTVHDHMAMGFLTGGSAVMHLRERYEVQAGDVFLVPAGEPHGLVTARSSEAWGVGFCPTCFSPAELALLDPFTRVRSGASVVVHIPPDRREHLAHLCAELHRETQAAPPAAHVDLVQKSLLALILTEVARASAVTAGAGHQPTLVGEALRFIERHAVEPISLRDVAAALHKSPSYVATAVKAATGKTVVAWIAAGRMAEARRRLLHTDEMVDVIAERVGYADSTHFIRLFRRTHGHTPAAWRTQTRATRGAARDG